VTLRNVESSRDTDRATASAGRQVQPRIVGDCEEASARNENSSPDQASKNDVSLPTTRGPKVIEAWLTVVDPGTVSIAKRAIRSPWSVGTRWRIVNVLLGA